MSVVVSGFEATGCGLGRNEARFFGTGVIQSKGIMSKWGDTLTTVVASILM